MADKTYEPMPAARPHPCFGTNLVGIPTEWILYDPRHGWELNTTDAYGGGTVVSIAYCPWCGVRLAPTGPAATLQDYFVQGGKPAPLVVSSRTFEEVMAESLERHRANPRPFKPHATFNQDGDMIEAWWSDRNCYAEDAGPLTVYRAQDTGEIVGCQIHGVSRLKVV